MTVSWLLMNFREVNENDYPELSTWFSEIRKPYPVKDGVLPTIGVVAFDEQGLVSCCFIKEDGSSAKRLEWISSNPKRANAYRSEATTKLIEFVCQMIKASSSNAQVIEIFTQSDFLISACVGLKWTPIRNFTRLMYSYEDKKD